MFGGQEQQIMGSEVAFELSFRVTSIEETLKMPYHMNEYET